MAAIPNANLSTNSLVADTRSLNALKSSAQTDPKTAAREAARQFETLFMQQLMKSMRAATPSSGLMDNQGTQLGTDLLDSQMMEKLSARTSLATGSLSDMIARQLERQMGLTPGPIPRTGSANNTPTEIGNSSPTQVPQKGAAGFVQQHSDAAKAAEAATGIPANFMLSQAALETGWGRKEIRHADGTSANNLFGIKAGSNWKGPVAEVMTTEYVNGKAQKVVQKFRAYGSYAESFSDYAKLMKDNPRYERVIAAGPSAKGFAQGLQRAGYATDPAYADKLAKVINTTLRLQRSLA
ncbi:flagellar rod assembly protein/muramidase FlgJ [Burkholderiales bacterium JOSHI_001]|nr:flagellar rod assembly protein/muramidase FlgJ [Burkholderiales bacterium JOSHI_001]